MISTASVSVKKSELKNLTDDQLMALVAADSNDALAMLMKRYSNMARHYANRLIVDYHQAEEVINVAFSRVWVHRHNFSHHRGTFKTWVMHIIRNLAFNANRNQHRKNGPLDSLDELVEIGNMLPSSMICQSAETIAIGRLTNATIMELFDRLPKRQRDVLTLWIKSYSGDEIAATLNIPRGTVGSRIQRAREFLQNQPVMRELLAA